MPLRASGGAFSRPEADAQLTVRCEPLQPTLSDWGGGALVRDPPLRPQRFDRSVNVGLVSTIACTLPSQAVDENKPRKPCCVRVARIKRDWWILAETTGFSPTQDAIRGAGIELYY